METKKIVVEVESNLGSLKSQLREAQAEVSAMSEKFGATSVEAINAAKAAARLKDTIGDAKILTDAFNPDAKFKALTASMSGALNGFQAVQGAMGLFGAEGKEVQEMMLKVQSAMALTQGIDGVLESVDSFKTLAVWLGITKKAKVVDTAITATQATVTTTATAATGGMTLAQKALNLVMKANPIFLIIAGIGLLVGAFALFSGGTGTAKESVADLNKELERLDENFALDIEGAENLGQRLLNQAKLRGASSTELLKIEKANANELLNTKWKHTQDTIKANEKIANSENATEEETTAAYKKINQAIDKQLSIKREAHLLSSQFALKEKEINDDKVKEEEAKAKEAADRAKAANDKARAEKKAALDSIRVLEKEYNDSLLSDHDLEVLKVEEKYAKEIALAKKYKQDTETLESARKTALNEIELKTEQARLKIIEDADIAAKKMVKQHQDDFNNEMIALDEANTERINQKLLTAQEIELLAVQDKYYALEEAARGNAEQMAIIADSKGAEENAINDKYKKENLDKEKSVQNAKMQMASDAIGVIGELANALAGKSEASQKRAFNINKAASIAQATISTYQAAQSAYASQIIPGDPSSLIRGAIAAGISVASGIAKVAMIAKTQFNSNGGGGGGGNNAPTSLPTSSAPTPANFNLVGNSNTNQLLQGLQNQPIQAYVVGGDVTSQQSLDRNKITTASI